MFLTYERNVVKLAEHMGLPLAYATGLDIAAGPALLDGAAALISPGHDEYWSRAERAHVTAARDAIRWTPARDNLDAMHEYPGDPVGSPGDLQ